MASTANGTKPENSLAQRAEGKDADLKLPDARLFATWDYEQKNFRDSLSVARASKLKGAQFQMASNPASAVDAPPRRGSTLSAISTANGLDTPNDRRNGILTLPLRRESSQAGSFKREG
jgi:hypothetical protein